MSGYGSNLCDGVTALWHYNPTNMQARHTSKVCTSMTAVDSPQVGLEVLRDLAHQPLEGQLADQQLCGLLVLADLTQRHSSRAVAVGLLHTACRTDSATWSFAAWLEASTDASQKLPQHATTAPLHQANRKRPGQLTSSGRGLASGLRRKLQVDEMGEPVNTSAHGITTDMTASKTGQQDGLRDTTTGAHYGMLKATCRLHGNAQTCLRGALPPVDLRAVCFVRAMVAADC